MGDDVPFFIVGAGRSGSTLLRLIMTGHSRLHIPPETWFLVPLLQEFPLAAVLTQPQVERAIATMVRHERWPDMDLPADILQDRAAALRQPRLADLIDLVHRHLLAAAGKPRLGDKTPHYFAIVPQLAALYPAAKFIHLQRDGHDVAMSWIDAGWPRYYEPGFEWPLAMASLRRDKAAYPQRLHTVHYEDLMREPEATIRGICTFLNETFEPPMLDWQGRIGQVAKRDRHLHGRLRQPLAETSVALWRQRLSAAECFAIEACLHQELAAHGYALRFAGRPWRPLFRIMAGLLRTLTPALRRGIPYLQRRRWLPEKLYF